MDGDGNNPYNSDSTLQGHKIYSPLLALKKLRVVFPFIWICFGFHSVFLRERDRDKPYKTGPPLPTKIF